MEDKKNEKEIKENCIIKIDNKIIEFNYFYKFNKGKYKIEYIFRNNITKTNYMFSGCSSLANINLSNFNTQIVTNMSFMFYNCSSLTNINLSNFSTQIAININFMFSGCNLLKKII